jgi:hypothetical protein
VRRQSKSTKTRTISYGPAALAGPGTIEIEFATGGRMRIARAVDPETLTAATAATPTCVEGEHPYVYLDGIVLKRSWAASPT